jgi:hypothetical protein
MHRSLVRAATRLVVKLGKGVLTGDWPGVTGYNQK